MTEVDLCGHATLAAAFVLFTELRPDLEAVRFQSVSGPLAVAREGDRLVLDFPSRPPQPIPPVPGLSEALGARVLETHLSRDVVAVLGSEAEVRALEPDFQALTRIPPALLEARPAKEVTHGPLPDDAHGAPGGPLAP